MPPTPRDDQNAIRFRDLQRLQDLTAPYVTDGSVSIVDVLALMPAADRDEASTILDRISDLGEPADKRAARQEILLDLAEAENHLQDVLARRQPLVRDGQVVIDPDTGKPLPDPAIERNARELLARLERLRSSLTGLPADPEDAAAGDGEQL